jgi:hypothetical protein
MLAGAAAAWASVSAWSAGARAGAQPAPDDDGPPLPHVDTGRHGRPLVYEPPPPPGPSRACSLRLPICVDGPAGSGATALAVIASAERAWDVMTGALGIAPPDLDPDTLAYPIHLAGPLAGGVTELASTAIAARDVRSPIDRARAFTIVDGRARPGCQLDGAIASALARAALARVAPAMDEGSARSSCAYVAGLVAPCSIAYAADAARAFQSRPERTIVDAHVGDAAPAPRAWPDPPGSYRPASRLFMDGAAMFWSRIDWAFARRPAGLVRAVWAFSATTTPPGVAEWYDEPDPFDVLRVSFRGALHTGSTFADLLLEAAVARAFVGAADDGVHQPELATLGDAARVALDFEMDWPVKPRRIAPRAPVAPTGSSYLVIRRAGAPPGARLRVEIAWEEHAVFRWALVKVDARGRELGRVVIPQRERATEAQMTLVDLDRADRVLLVGVNTGDPSYGFDPDDEVWEPHAWLVTLAAE